MDQDEIWGEFAEDVRRMEHVLDSYPKSLAEIRRLWLPPQGVIDYLTKVAMDKGVSDEAAKWLHRVTVARQSDHIDLNE